jgi:hypothetical protein
MTLTEFAKLMADFEAEAKKVGAISNVGTVPEGVVFQLRLGGYHGKIAMSWRELEETADPSIILTSKARPPGSEADQLARQGQGR